MPHLLYGLFQEKDVALVERRIMFTHVTNSVKLFLTMNTDVNNLSVGGMCVLQSASQYLVVWVPMGGS